MSQSIYLIDKYYLEILFWQTADES